jgi:DNA-binding NtrC family response regulator
MNTFPEIISEADAPVHQPAIHATPRILVVDDESSMREFVSEALASCGYEVDKAEGGIAALEALHAQHYDMLVSDVNMPKGSGPDLIIKMHTEGIVMPVILMTGAAVTRELASLSNMLHVSAMLSKPFSMDDLVKTVETFLPLDHHPITEVHPAVPISEENQALSHKSLDQ